MAINTVWGIDIGQCALKAVKLVSVEDGLRLDGYEVIEHSSTLTEPDADIGSLVRASLGEFLRRQDTSNANIAVSVLGKSSFTRFVKLPPVEPKEVPRIIQFEAGQQIPFPLSEVIWRYKCFQDPDSPDVEVGLFAVKHADMSEMLSYFIGMGLEPDVMQMPSLALYNFMIYDGQLSMDEGATIMVDIGADKTQLVVADGSRLWIRTIRIGGDSFTNALAKSFKLSFSKADKLKRTAASSKYARQVFQVMRPIFADLVQEIQRSIGFYTSQHRDARFSRMLGMGNGFRLPGIQKYFEQNLNVEVAQIEQFNRIQTPSDQYRNDILSLGVAYGLALQALGTVPVETNMLPSTILRKRLWTKKKVWFAAVSVILVLMSAVVTFSAARDAGVLKSDEGRQLLEKAREKLPKYNDDIRDQEDLYNELVSKELDLFKAKGDEQKTLRDKTGFWPGLMSEICRAMLQTTMSSSELSVIDEFALAPPETRRTLATQVQSEQGTIEIISMLPYTDGGEVNEFRERLISRVQQVPRNSRRIIILEELTPYYVPDLNAEDLSTQIPALAASDFDVIEGIESPVRGFVLFLRCRTPLSRERAVEMINRLKNNMVDRLRSSDAEPRFPFALLGEVAVVFRQQKTATPIPDPFFPGETINKDFIFDLLLRIQVLDGPSGGSGKENPE